MPWRLVTAAALLSTTAFAQGLPSVLELLWPRSPAGVNPRPADRALALFDEDENNAALTCPESRFPPQPGGEMVRCEYSPTASVGPVWAGVTRVRNEHEGMYSLAEEVVLVSASDSPEVLHTLTQWQHSVTDCSTHVVHRRYRMANLDTDGDLELCIESVEEEGPGLFHVMDLEEVGLRWYPVSRTRGFTAWELDASGLRRRSTLDERCPRSDYRRFVPTTAPHRTVRWREAVQGRDRRGLAIGRRRLRYTRVGC